MNGQMDYGQPEREAARRLIAAALEEDLGRVGDITSRAFLDPTWAGRARIVSRESGVLAGLPVAVEVYRTVDPSVTVECFLEDGGKLSPGSVIAEVRGRTLSLLEAERTALNFLTHLSGIASLTARFVEAVRGTRAKILDTRKTLPGWRLPEKYAVRAGGGTNHRIGLYDAVLIKDNHLAAFRHARPQGSLAEAVRAVREKIPVGTIVEVEVDRLEQLREVLPGGPDIVLLDNMSLDLMRAAVSIRNETAPIVLLEASGGVNLERVRGIAETGVERISVGALTHSAGYLDLGLDWSEAT